MRTLLALLLGSLMSTAALAQTAEPEIWRDARVRPQDPRLVELLRAGVARSATFRSLVNRLEAGNVIVYITLSQTLRRGLALRLPFPTELGHLALQPTVLVPIHGGRWLCSRAHKLAIHISPFGELALPNAIGVVVPRR